MITLVNLSYNIRTSVADINLYSMDYQLMLTILDATVQLLSDMKKQKPNIIVDHIRHMLSDIEKNDFNPLKLKPSNEVNIYENSIYIVQVDELPQLTDAQKQLQFHLNIKNFNYISLLYSTCCLILTAAYTYQMNYNLIVAQMVAMFILPDSSDDEIC